MIESILNIAQLAVAIPLIILILLQNKGAGLGGVFGGGEGNVYTTKRGAEKILFTSTVILAVLFLGIAFTNFLI